MKAIKHLLSTYYMPDPRPIPINTLRKEELMSQVTDSGLERARDLIKATQRCRQAPTLILRLSLASELKELPSRSRSLKYSKSQCFNYYPGNLS